MIDVHSHIIPGIDDGARTMEMALDMARQSADCGVTHLVCTPHMHWGTFDNTAEIIEQGFVQLQQAVNEPKIDLSLSWAGEIRINEMVPAWFKQNKLPYLGQKNGKNVNEQKKFKKIFVCGALLEIHRYAFNLDSVINYFNP